MSKSNPKLADRLQGPTHQDKAREREKALAKRIGDLEQQLASALDSIDKQRHSAVRVLKGKPTETKGTFSRFIIADTHGCWIDNKAAAAMLRDLELIRPQEIVLMGDHLDCAGWLANHHPFKTVQEAKYSFREDVEAANWFLDEVCNRAPSARIHYLEGNHEERIEAWIVEQTKQDARDAAYLRTMFSPETVLGLEKRKITYYRRTAKHSRLRLRGMLRLGKCHFVHGISHARNAASVHLQKVKTNVVFGHTHRPQEDSTADTLTEYGAWCPGCLCEFEPMWKHSQPTEWAHGYGLQCVASDGSFVHINARIVNGTSLLLPLIENTGK